MIGRFVGYIKNTANVFAVQLVISEMAAYGLYTKQPPISHTVDRAYTQ